MSKKHPAAVALGRLGGLAKSRRKTDAAKANGRKGGRPPRAVRTFLTDTETRLVGTWRTRADGLTEFRARGTHSRIVGRFRQDGDYQVFELADGASRILGWFQD